MKVRYTRRAFRQMNAILDYIDDHSPQGARSVKQRLQAAIDLVAAHPHGAPLIGKRDLRRVVVTPYPYLIFYRVTPDEIVIHGVRHAARRPRR
ncbi:MAG: type II toxin-antitoxin system RelE/ParE family toxin [Xanthobacteraceae bacterium]